MQKRSHKQAIDAFPPTSHPTSIIYSTFWFLQGHCSLFLVSQVSSYLLFSALKLAPGCFSAHLHVSSRCFSSHLQGYLVLDAMAGDSVVVCVSLIVLFMCGSCVGMLQIIYLFVRLLSFSSSVRGVCCTEMVTNEKKNTKQNKTKQATRKRRVRIFIAQSLRDKPSFTIQMPSLGYQKEILEKIIHQFHK